MEEEVFSTELASISELSDRWGVPSHQLVYAVRSRHIPCARRAGTVRLFDIEQQKEIYSHLRKHLVEESPVAIEMYPILPALQEEEAQEVERQRQEIDELKARLVILERLVADLLEGKKL